MDTVLSAIQASENKVLNEIRFCCQILYLVYSTSLIYHANFVKRRKLSVNIPKAKVVVFKKGPVLARNEQSTFGGQRLEVVNYISKT